MSFQWQQKRPDQRRSECLLLPAVPLSRFTVRDGGFFGFRIGQLQICHRRVSPPLFKQAAPTLFYRIQIL
jgi:hypothetical protein